MRTWASRVLTDPTTTAAAVALLAVISVAVRPLARWRNWPVWTTLGLLLGAAAIAVLTLLPAPGHPVTGPVLAELTACARSLTSPDHLWTHGLLATTQRGERVGNVAMFVPFTFFAVLCLRRPLLVAVGGMLLPVAVEVAQAFTGGGRSCAGYDWVNNACGALLGAVLGTAVIRLMARAERRAASRSDRMG